MDRFAALHGTHWWCVLESADNYSWSLEMLSPSKGEPLWPAGTFTAAAAAPWPEWRPSNYGSSIIGSKHYVGHQYWKKYLYLYTSRKWHNYNQAQLNVFIENLFCCVCFPMCSKKEVLLVSIVARARWCWWEHLVSFLLCCVTHSEYYLHYCSREDPTGCPTIEFSLCFACFLSFQRSYRRSFYHFTTAQET